MIGVPPTGATVPLNIQPMVSQERVVRGSIYGSARTREDFPRWWSSIWPGSYTWTI